MWQIKTLVYLFQVSVGLLAFFAIYIIFLRNLTFFKINRAYLLFGLMASFAIPSLELKMQSDVVVFKKNSPVYDKVEQLTTISSTPIAENNLSSISLTDILLAVYLVVMLLILSKGIKSVMKVLQYTNKDRFARNGLKVIYKRSGFVNCSFFNYVFINPADFNKQELEIILKHEKVHAQQWHSADKLFILLCKSILWFNPLIYFYAKELEKSHEFEADVTVLNTVDTKTYAQLLMRLAISQRSNQVVHNFGKHPVKERIFMLFTPKSKVWTLSIYTLILPIFIGLISFRSFKLVATNPFMKSDFTLILDPGHGGLDHGAMNGHIYEKQIALSIVKKIKSIADTKGLKVLLSRTDDSKVTLKQRAELKGDVLLSIHHNSSTDHHKSGIEIISGSSSTLARQSIIHDLTFNLYQNLTSVRDMNTLNISKEVTGSYILAKSTAPSIMLELGYITNAHDRALLMDPQYQTRLAEAIVTSVIEHRDHFNTQH